MFSGKLDGANMQVWSECVADVLFYDADIAVTNEEGYIVRIADDVIEVAYDDDDGPVCYRGKDHGDGHYSLSAPERQGKASLHRFPDGAFMEGFWREGGMRGMWRIQLK